MFLSQLFCLQIEIRELDDFAQTAFRGYKSLNRIQSRIFQTVYYTNENILVSHLLHYLIYLNTVGEVLLCFNESVFIYFQVCAPTGAGKTNIAMISILHEVCNKFPASVSLFVLVDYLAFVFALLRYWWGIPNLNTPH